MRELNICGVVFSITDVISLITAIILLITVGLVIWYAWETRLMRKEMQAGYKRESERRRKQRFNYLAVTLHEIRRTFERVESYVRLWQKEQVSFSRLYYPEFDKLWPDFLKINNDLELNHVIDNIYYRFYQINYNIDQRNWPGAIGFAQYLVEIYANYNYAVKKLKRWADELGVAVPSNIQELLEDDLTNRVDELQLKPDPKHMQPMPPDEE